MRLITENNITLKRDEAKQKARDQSRREREEIKTSIVFLEMALILKLTADVSYFLAAYTNLSLSMNPEALTSDLLHMKAEKGYNIKAVLGNISSVGLGTVHFVVIYHYFNDTFCDTYASSVHFDVIIIMQIII